MMRLALDFDGVLSDTMKLWCHRYNQLYDRKITLNDIQDWDFFTSLGLSFDEAYSIFNWCWSNQEMLTPLESDVTQHVNKIAEEFNIDIVTSVIPEHIPDIKKWLDRYEIPYDNIIHSNKKHELDYSLFIDDSPDNITNMIKSGRNALIYTQSWNKHLEFPRILSLSEVLPKAINRESPQ